MRRQARACTPNNWKLRTDNAASARARARVRRSLLRGSPA